MEFREIILDIRKTKELSQMELAKLLNVSQSAIAKWELGKTEPTKNAIETIYKVFGITPNELCEVDEYFGMSKK